MTYKFNKEPYMNHDQLRVRFLASIAGKPWTMKALAHQIGITYFTLRKFLKSDLPPVIKTMMKINNFILRQENN